MKIYTNKVNKESISYESGKEGTRTYCISIIFEWKIKYFEHGSVMHIRLSV